MELKGFNIRDELNRVMYNAWRYNASNQDDKIFLDSDTEEFKAVVKSMALKIPKEPFYQRTLESKVNSEIFRLIQDLFMYDAEDLVNYLLTESKRNTTFIKENLLKDEIEIFHGYIYMDNKCIISDPVHVNINDEFTDFAINVKMKQGTYRCYSTIKDGAIINSYIEYAEHDMYEEDEVYDIAGEVNSDSGAVVYLDSDYASKILKLSYSNNYLWNEVFRTSAYNTYLDNSEYDSEIHPDEHMTYRKDEKLKNQIDRRRDILYKILGNKFGGVFGSYERLGKFYGFSTKASDGNHQIIGYRLPDENRYWKIKIDLTKK